MARYPFPWDLVLRLTLIRPSRRASLVDDARAMVKRCCPAPRVRDPQHIPPDGPVMLASNHYQRRGLWIGWPGALMTAAVADRRSSGDTVHWLVTGGVRLCQSANTGPEIPGMRLVFRRVAEAYEMTALPLSGAPERSSALRQWLRRVHEGGVIGIFPEGVAGRAGTFGPPLPGFDALCRHLAARGIPVLPAGVSECNGRLTVAFGTPMMLDGAETGAVLAGQVMCEIARLLPNETREAFVGSTRAAGSV